MRVFLHRNCFRGFPRDRAKRGGVERGGNKEPGDAERLLKYRGAISLPKVLRCLRKPEGKGT